MRINILVEDDGFEHEFTDEVDSDDVDLQEILFEKLVERVRTFFFD